MRLNKESTVYDDVNTYGVCIFDGLAEERMKKDEEGNETGELEKRVYFLICEKQGEILKVNVPSTLVLKDFKKGDKVQLVGSNASHLPPQGYGRNATVDFYITATDIVKVDGKVQGQPQGQSQGQPQAQPK